MKLTESWNGYHEFKTTENIVGEYYRAVHRCYELALRDLLNGNRAKNALEVACGSGESTKVLADFTERIVGVDCCEALLDVAKKGTYPAATEFHHAVFEEFRTQESFELVTGAWYHGNLHSEQSQQAALKKIVSSLQPGGKICFVTQSDSFISSQMQQLAGQMGWQQAWMEQTPQRTRGIFTFGRDDRWLPVTVWQPLYLMRLYRRWFTLRSWDVKQTLVDEGWLEEVCMEPPFELIYGQLR